MIYILDFDGVLFDDQRFKSDFRHVFNRHGVTHSAYAETYHQAKEANKGMYELDVHLTIISRMDPHIDIKNLRNDLFILAGRSHKYIFTDTNAFLRGAQKRGDILFLLSSGDKLFQEKKINASGLISFFKGVFITASSSKIALLVKIKKQAGRGEITCIDDKKEVVDEIKKYNPKIKVMQMIRSTRMPKSEHADAHIKSFLELLRYTSKNATLTK